MTTHTDAAPSRVADTLLHDRSVDDLALAEALLCEFYDHLRSAADDGAAGLPADRPAQHARVLSTLAQAVADRWTYWGDLPIGDWLLQILAKGVWPVSSAVCEAPVLQPSPARSSLASEKVGGARDAHPSTWHAVPSAWAEQVASQAQALIRLREDRARRRERWLMYIAALALVVICLSSLGSLVPPPAAASVPPGVTEIVYVHLTLVVKPTQPATATPTRRPTKTPTPTRTRFPTQTPGPSRTPLPSKTPTITPYYLTLADDRPAAPPVSYSLYATGPDNLWALVSGKLPEDFYYDFNSPYSSSEWGEMREVLRKEVKARFPGWTHPPHQGHGSEYTFPFEDFHSSLEDELNNSQIFDGSEAGLKRLLYRLFPGEEFTVEAFLPVNNLMANGQPGWVVGIRHNYYRAAVFALSGTPEKFRLAPIRPNWVTFAWSDQTVSSEDLNANGIPEIVILYDGWGMGFSHFAEAELSVYEWDGEMFRNLTPDVWFYTNTDSGDLLEFKFIPGPGASKTITGGYQISGYFSSECKSARYTVQSFYEWDGTLFRLDRTELLPVDAPDECMLYWVSHAAASNERAFELLPRLLENSNPAVVNRWKKDWGPAYQDFFRFKLGTWYAMRGMPEQALAELEQVRSMPAAPEYPYASQMAEAFLRRYSPGGDPAASGTFAGCADVNRLFHAVEVHQGEWYGGGSQQVMEMFGFSDPLWSASYFGFPAFDNQRDDPINLCSTKDALRYSIRGLSFSSAPDLARWLAAERIPYAGLHQADLDGDGRLDYLVLLGTGSSDELQLWALMDTAQGIEPLLVTGREFRTQPVETRWASFEPVAGTLVNVYHFGAYTHFFRVFQLHGAYFSLIGPIDYGYSAKSSSFTVVPAPGGGEKVRVSHTVRRGALSFEEWYEYGWSLGENQVSQINSYQQEQDRRLAAAEDLLFSGEDPARAVQAYRELLVGPNRLVDYSLIRYRQTPTLRPRLLYRLGLAFELNNEPHHAAAIYWTLWDEYPAHPLALAARLKLGR